MLIRNGIRLSPSLLKNNPQYLISATKPYSTQNTATTANNEQDDLLLKSAKPFNQMPSPTMWPVIGSAWMFMPVVGRFNILRSHLANRHKRKLYGNAWREKFGSLSIAISYQAEDMEALCRNEGPYPRRAEFSCIKTYRESRKQWYQSTGLLVLEGKEWHDLRSKTQKHLMKPKAVQAYMEAMQDVAYDFVQRMDQIKDSQNEVPDFLQELYKWSLESVAYVGLDARLGALQTKESDGMRLVRSVQTQFELLGKLEGFVGKIPFWKLFLGGKWKTFEKASDEFSEIAFKYINQACDKLKTMDPSADQDLTLLQAMLAEKGLEIGGVLVMVADMLFAGIDTTSHTAGFLLYELAKNPDKQEILYQEIRNLLSTSGGRLTPSLLTEIKYLKACIKESLRLHAIVPASSRILDKDIVISGYRVPKQTMIVIMTPEMGLDERYYKNPSQFIPERWMNKEEKSHPFAYLPFGFGPRSCIGRRLAELEITCLIVEVIKRFKVEYKYEDIDIFTKFIHTPDKPLRFNFIARH